MDYTYVQVNIGRNIDTEPMDYREWAGFKLAVEEAILAATDGYPLVQVNEGLGSWVDEDGLRIVEESAYLSVFAIVDIDALRATLTILKATYEQDAIALIVGSELI